jgi:hypothetical protein
VVKTAISLSALPLMGGALASRTDAFLGSGLRDVLVDERNDASRAFGRSADAQLKALAEYLARKN